MAWLRLDDGFTRNLKVASLSDRAFRLHVTALCYCAANLTDGTIPEFAIKLLLAEARTTKRTVSELEQAGLWIGDGPWEVKDFLDYNPTADKVKRQRQQTSERQARFRARHNDVEGKLDYAAIAERDGWLCYLCGGGVKHQEASYDHVVPLSRGGSHSYENVRLVHARCNSRKGSRDAHEATRYKRVGEDATPAQPVPVVLQGFSAVQRGGPLERLLEACTDKDEGTEGVILSLHRRYKLSEADFEWARECAKGPGVDSPSGVAVRELQKRGMSKRVSA